jgi:tetratricopeptide (TPR) repeat protein
MEKQWDFKFTVANKPFEEGVELSYAEAEKVLQEKLRAAKDSPKDALWELARFYSACKQHEKALECLRKVMDLLPDLEGKASCVLGMGQTMEQIQDFESAIKYYREALSLEPVASTTWYFINNNLGYCLNIQGKFEEGEIYCRKAIEIEPGRPNAHKNLGISFEGQGKLREAANCYIMATRVNAADSRSYKLLMNLLEKNPALKPEYEEDARKCGDVAKIAFLYKSVSECAVTKAPNSSGRVGYKPTRQLSLQPVAAEASMEAMKCSKPLV